MRTTVNEFGQETIQPNQYIFLFAAIVVLLAIVPLIFLLKKEKADEQVSVE